MGTSLREGIIYSCTGENIIKNCKFIGLTSKDIKQRISKHQTSFKYEQLRKVTTLSKQMWIEKDSNIISKLSWEKIAYAKERGANQKYCNICNKETLSIMREGNDLLNERNELGGYCAHRGKYLIKNIPSNKVIGNINLDKT